MQVLNEKGKRAGEKKKKKHVYIHSKKSKVLVCGCVAEEGEEEGRD